MIEAADGGRRGRHRGNMRLFYGWIIVGVGIVVTCVGLGAMLSLSVFLAPMSASMGWSRTGISMAALLNFLSMGVGSFAWGALSDRFGTRAVVLCGGVLLGLGLVTASQAATLGQFQVLFGVIVGFSAGSLYTPLTATTTRWFTQHRSLAVALVSAGLSLGSSTAAPLARWLITSYDWRFAMLVIGDLAWLVIIPAAWLVREPPALPTAAVVPAVAVSLYLFTRDTASFYALALMFGFAYGGVMPLYAILVREYFGERIMGTVFGAVAFVSTLGMALGPWAGGWLYDAFGSYFWLYIGSFGIGLGAVAIAVTFRPPRRLPAALSTASLAR